MSGIVNQVEDSWDAWLQAGEKEVAADLAAVHDGGSPDAGHDDWPAAQPDAHHEADLYASHQDPSPTDEAAEIDKAGFTGTGDMMIDNMTSEDLPTYF
jgi:hypothetical protein